MSYKVPSSIDRAYKLPSLDSVNTAEEPTATPVKLALYPAVGYFVRRHFFQRSEPERPPGKDPETAPPCTVQEYMQPSIPGAYHCP